MSNSVVFLMIAVGLSVVGTFVVWLHGRPRRSRSSVDVFNRSLRALATDDTRHEPLSGVTVRPFGDLADGQQPDGFDANGFDESHADNGATSGVDSNGADVIGADTDGRVRTPRPSPRPKPRPAAPRRDRSSRQGADPGA